MKKILISLLVFVFIIGCAKLYANEPSLDIQPIDKIQNECISKKRTTIGMNECSIKARNLWFEEIDRYLFELEKITSKEDYARILGAQNDWKKFQESEFKAIGIIFNKQSSAFRNTGVNMQTDLIKQRALFLKKFYTELAN